jgi:hypothetical protein
MMQCNITRQLFILLPSDYSAPYLNEYVTVHRTSGGAISSAKTLRCGYYKVTKTFKTVHPELESIEGRPHQMMSVTIRWRYYEQE